MRLYFLLIGCFILLVYFNENKWEILWNKYYKGSRVSTPEVVIKFHEGDSMLKHITRFNKFSQLDGIAQAFYDNGCISVLEYHKDDVPHGLKIVFYETGGVERIENYKEGLRDGWFYGYYENGEKRYEIKWRNNKRVSAVEYDRNGSLIFQE